MELVILTRFFVETIWLKTETSVSEVPTEQPRVLLSALTLLFCRHSTRLSKLRCGRPINEERKSACDGKRLNYVQRRGREEFVVGRCPITLRDTN